ncbi:MAG: hypothetical protein K9M99_09285 [Candidatus Cloacimonetes bacterium]|nr:hypothetical protein [Candidatus Cloacimonadota bacterium]
MKIRRYLWEYGIDKLSGTARRNFISRIARDYGISDLFASMSCFMDSRSTIDEDRLEKMIIDMKPLAIHAMIFQDRFYLDDGYQYQERIKQELNALNNYNLTHSQNRIQGIHLDVEPHGRKDFKFERIHELFSRYIKLLACFRKHINQSEGFQMPDFQFSAATGWWYDAFPEVTMQELGRSLDAIVPMAYNSPQEPVGGNLERMQRKLPYEKWEKEAPPDTKFIVGMGFSEYHDINSVANPLIEWLKNRCPRTFAGLAFFSSHDILTEEEMKIING